MYDMYYMTICMKCTILNMHEMYNIHYTIISCNIV